MAHNMNAQSFDCALPVWLSGRETEKNLTVAFRTLFDWNSRRTRSVSVRLTASTLYRLWVNGKFAGYGPARAAHGFYRIDEWDVTKYCHDGSNLVAIEVVGYNVNSYYVLNQPSFLQAEVVCNGEVLAATGQAKDFQIRVLDERVQKVQRYSFQRPFVEIYRLQPTSDAWKHDLNAPFEGVEYSVVETKNLLARSVPYPCFHTVAPMLEVGAGTIEIRPVAHEWKDRSLTDVGPLLGGYIEDELEIVLSRDVQNLAPTDLQTYARPVANRDVNLPANTFRSFDFGTEKSGFIGLHVCCDKPVQLYITFDELLTNDDIDFSRLECVNALQFFLEPGEYRLESFESYSLRFAKVIAVGAALELREIYVREYANNDVNNAYFSSSNRELNVLFNAARETFRQNAVDVFSDCPSRERAGWLCDSLFTSRVAFDLMGNAQMQRMFLENYALPEAFPHLPQGVLPMCYPADHDDGVFIPNWILWFILELGEYSKRSGDVALIEQLRPKVEAAFQYFSRFHNNDGLLEGLEGWVFIEWSAANNFIHDVNYPSNMLYVAALEEAARLYGETAWNEQARVLRETIMQQSFRDGFFYDNAVRTEGALVTTENRTEVCQYYAFYFGFASPESHPELWRIVQERLGPTRRRKDDLEDIHPANALVGNLLRLELLSRQGLVAQIVEEYVPYWMTMASVTGTLWEHDDTRASCNHGFASHAAHVLLRDVLGIHQIDILGQRVYLIFADVDIEWCEARLPVPEGLVEVSWWHKNNERHFKVQLPAGYSLTVENRLSIELRQET